MRANKQMRAAIELGKKQQEERRYRVCGACNGSGVYDVKGSPKCAACRGLGHIEAWKIKGQMCCDPTKV